MLGFLARLQQRSMAKQEKNDNMGKLYRQFSRQKYNKYKHQYPKMRESEIVSKIIHQWDAMDRQAKQKLQRLYQNNRFLIKEDPQQSDSAKHSVEKCKIDKFQLQNIQEKPTAAKTAQKQEGDKMSENEKVNKYQQNQQISNFDSSLAATPRKTKKVVKLDKRDYLTFFKHYYADFHKEHPKWTSKQISEAIGLLWKRRKMQYKRSQPKRKQPCRLKKLVSGRVLFRTERKLNNQQCNTQWKHLPLESKNLWGNSGARVKEGECKMEGKMVLKSVCTDQGSTFGFLSKFMMR